MQNFFIPLFVVVGFSFHCVNGRETEKKRIYWAFLISWLVILIPVNCIPCVLNEQNTHNNQIWPISHRTSSLLFYGAETLRRWDCRIWKAHSSQRKPYLNGNAKTMKLPIDLVSCCARFLLWHIDCGHSSKSSHANFSYKALIKILAFIENIEYLFL